MIDTHTHIYLPEFDDDRAEMMQRAREAGVTHVLLPNVDLQSLAPLLALRAQNPEFFSVALGLHPTEVNGDFRDVLRQMEQAIAEAPFCRAIGEVGLDFYWDKTFEKEQIEAFHTQIGWAERLHIPVIVHAREAFPQLFAVLRERGGISVPVLFHCYSGNERQARELMTLCDAWFGIGGVATYKKSLMRETVPALPRDRMVLETDAPYLAPVPFRGKRNEPSYLTHTAAAVAGLLGLTAQQVEAFTDENARKLFGFPPAHSA